MKPSNCEGAVRLPIREIVEGLKRLYDERDEYNGALKLHGHDLKSPGPVGRAANLANAKKDARRPVQLLITEHEKLTQRIELVENETLTVPDAEADLILRALKG
jgi:hypothetical protein